MATSLSENLIQIFLHVLILVDARESFYSQSTGLEVDIQFDLQAEIRI